MNTQPETMTNHQGHLVPVSMIKEVDILRDELVKEIIQKALALQEQLRAFKHWAMGDIATFVEISAEKYGTKVGGNKGNVSLTSYDGRFKVVRSIADHITFDERLQAAKELIDQCINRWAEGSPDELRIIVNDAFQVDKEGKISTGKVLGLRRHDIRDPLWRNAMEAISDSVQVVGSKSYIRIYKRESSDDAWVAVPLDVAGV